MGEGMRPGRTGAAVLLLLLLRCAHCGAHAAPCVAVPPDPANTYDAPHTYAKLQRGYPFIRIADTAPPADVRIVAGQTYVQYGTRCLMLDLYLPAVSASAAGGGKPVPALPVVILVHGGGWRYGDRNEFAAMAIRLAQRGYAAAAISYRLSGEAPYPAAIHDVRAAVRWVRANAAAYGLDPGRVALAGGSAGGQIASLAGVTGDLGQFDPAGAGRPAGSLAFSAVQAIVNIDGLSDFTSEAARRYEDDPNKQPSSAGAWFGGRYAGKTALWREASPIQYVRAGMPPILFIGSAQPRFSVGRDEMAARMAAAGATSQTVILPDTPHSFWMFDPWLQPTVDAMLAFLNQHVPPR
jgi:acetyl esterase/lipase